ncbi:hypothetical protein J2Y69_000548 [Microbacterium resistens]|uniref:Uncharacterized protein n=1 Tax=Microbacterium resistens TaxID=156977 RepID=A0ABU1S8M8_9MICO|nr:hypothetical protein [Microbacterium resistens]MDR6865963.1 hypothetical protein [Microbacterium resistens]
MTCGRRVRGVHAVFAASVLSLGLLLSACTGDGESAAFQREFADESSIESMELTSHDNQPFTGGVSGDVIVREAVTDAEFTELAARVGSYTREHVGRMRGRVSLVVRGLEMVVTGDEQTDDDHVRLLLALRTDMSVMSAVIAEVSVSVGTTTAEEAIRLARNLPARLEDVATDRPWQLSVRSEGGEVAVTGDATAMAAAVRLWETLSASVPLTGIRAQEDSGVTATLRHEADVSRAQAVVAGMALGDDMTPTFASDLVRLGDSDGEDARLLLSRLDPDMRARIAYVWISDTRIQVAVRTEADFTVLASPVDTALPSHISEAWLVLSDDVETRVAVRPASADR